MNIFNCRAVAVLLVVVLLPAVGPALAAEVSAGQEGEHFLLRWQGDEDIQIRLPASGGLLGRSVTINVDGKEMSFDGFIAKINGKSSMEWKVVSEQSRLKGKRVIIEQTLQHPELKTPTKVRFEVWMEPGDKAIRFKIDMDDEKNLTYLGLGEHRGKKLGLKRMYFGNFVMDRPKAFKSGAPRKSKWNTGNRYWTLELDNGLTEMQGIDVAPLGFNYRPGETKAWFNIYTAYSSPVTFRFVLTGKGATEAFRQYRNSLGHKPRKALDKMVGRCWVMAWFPIKNNLEHWYKEFVGRGAREFVWLGYNWVYHAEGARIVADSDSLYATYVNYVDYFGPEAVLGKGLSPDWSAENCLYSSKGQLTTGWRKCNHMLPNSYIEWITKGRKMFTDQYTRDQLVGFGVNAFYFDVHAIIMGKDPYFDYKGKQYSPRECIRHNAKLFDLFRNAGHDAPITSEMANEWFAEHIEGGCFNAIWKPSDFNITGQKWEYYPCLDQVHRQWHLPVGIGWHYCPGYPFYYRDREWGKYKSPFQERVALNVLFGRSELIDCYYNADLSRTDSRLMSYYLHSAYHKMLGKSGIKKIDFDKDNIHHPIVHYDNGATIRVNRADDEWVVEDRRLLKNCYLIEGPDFLQYCEVPKGKDYPVEFVKSNDYWLFVSPEMHDFGAAKVSGAYAIRLPEPGKIVVYQIKGTNDMISLHLPTILGKPGPYKLDQLKSIRPIINGRVIKEYIVRRRTEVKDDWLIFEPTQDPHTWRYEIEIEKLSK